MIALTALDNSHVYVDTNTGMIVRKPASKNEYDKGARAVINMMGYQCAVKETPEEIRAIIEAAPK